MSAFALATASARDGTGALLHSIHVWGGCCGARLLPGAVSSGTSCSFPGTTARCEKKHADPIEGLVDNFIETRLSYKQVLESRKGLSI